VADRAWHIAVDGRELVGHPTGVGRYVGEVLRDWIADPAFPHRVTVILHQAPPAELAAALGPRVSWMVVADRTGGTWWEQTRLPGALRRAGAEVLLAGAYTAPLRSPCPYVLAVHDVSFFAHPEWFRWREGLRRRWITRAAARRAARVLTLSEFSAGEIVRWIGLPRHSILLAPPGGPQLAPPRQASADPLVLFAGSLLNRRKIPELIAGFARAAGAVPGARLVLVGDNRTTPRIEPLALAAAHGVADRVEWRAYVSDAELNRLYDMARAFLFLSTYEGFGMTPFEAIAHGVPAVVLDTPVSREVYGDGARRVTTDAHSIASALVPLLTDHAAHAAALAAGRARLARFSWAQTAATIRAALEDAAASR
jgi:glycosyltransferase involved in cell wall biosynthesis